MAGTLSWGMGTDPALEDGPPDWDTQTTRATGRPRLRLSRFGESSENLGTGSENDDVPSVQIYRRLGQLKLSGLTCDSIHTSTSDDRLCLLRVRDPVLPANDTPSGLPARDFSSQLHSTAPVMPPQPCWAPSPAQAPSLPLAPGEVTALPAWGTLCLPLQAMSALDSTIRCWRTEKGCSASGISCTIKNQKPRPISMRRSTTPHAGDS